MDRTSASLKEILESAKAQNRDDAIRTALETHGVAFLKEVADEIGLPPAAYQTTWDPTAHDGRGQAALRHRNFCLRLFAGGGEDGDSLLEIQTSGNRAGERPVLANLKFVAKSYPGFIGHCRSLSGTNDTVLRSTQRSNKPR